MEESKALKANTIKFPFLIGKVLTGVQGEYDPCNFELFPFLIGKVLTITRYQKKPLNLLKCFHSL